MTVSHSDLPLSRRLLDSLAMFGVAAISMTLLIYIAFGEARRTYEQFQIEKLVAQGQVAQSAVEGFVRPGLPMHQFVGFNGLTEPMVNADPIIDAIAAYDMADQRVFAAGDDKAVLIGSSEGAYRTADGAAEVRHTGELLLVVLPIRNRFEQVGNLVLSSARNKVAERVEEAFLPLVGAALGVSIAFALFVLFSSSRLSAASRTKWIGASFAIGFLTVAFLVVTTLVSVYSQGAQARAKALADSLGQRLDDIVIYNLNLDDISGIISLYGDYKRLNRDIRAAALLVDGKVRAHTDPMRRDVDWDHVPENYEYSVRISPPENPRDIRVIVALPRDVVFREVARSVKNFGALFVASACFAGLFMGVARSLQRLAMSKSREWSVLEETATIDLVKPVFFLAVFAENMSYAFLPQMMQAAATAGGLPAAYASAPFVGYYLCFALSLIPAGRFEAKTGPRKLIFFGLTLAALGMALMATTADFWIAFLARCLSGLGQGTLFIGVQAYVLANSSPERRTRAGGAIVFGFQAGMIAGMAIGSLLVSYVGPIGIFKLAGGISLATALYGYLALPARVSAAEVSGSLASVWRDTLIMIRDSEFLRSILLIGVPAKAVLTGVVLFGLPLLLSEQGFAKEDIGQITMLYAAAVIFASHFASMWADRHRSAERIIFQGACLTAVGLTIMSLVGLKVVVDWGTSPIFGTLLILVGVVIVGFSHGFINAPVVTHVTESELATRVGATNVAASYRLIERIGHVLGPIIMGQVFLHLGQSWTTLAWIALTVFSLGILFLSPARPTGDRENAEQAA
jgi:predicted MFS family arabinose efflux permease